MIFVRSVFRTANSWYNTKSDVRCQHFLWHFFHFFIMPEKSPKYGCYTYIYNCPYSRLPSDILYLYILKLLVILGQIFCLCFQRCFYSLLNIFTFFISVEFDLDLIANLSTCYLTLKICTVWNIISINTYNDITCKKSAFLCRRSFTYRIYR